MPTNSDSPSTSLSLIARVQQNEPEARERLVELYAPLVYQWCRWTKLPEQDIADVMQDVFLSVFRSIVRFRRERPDDSFRGWLYTITSHGVNDKIRKLVRQPQSPGGTTFADWIRQLPDQLEEGDDALIPSESALYRRALGLIQAEFADHTWRAALAMIEGRTSAEVAEQFGMTANAVRNAKYKVLRRLREELGEL